MGAKIKPTQPTVIKDKKTVRDVIAEIHRKPTQNDLARLRERREILKRAKSK
jgi:ribosome-interacting GTPase 1